MKKIAFYGKGGIGKSTTAANVSAALSTAGHKVCQIGCDPKNDSTRLLLGHICKNTVLDMVRIKDEINLEDIVLYDVLGDVVCGGFAVPIREGYATDIYIVSSGELMSLYAANNIAKGIRRFAGRGEVKLAGIIGNGRNVPNEENLLRTFAEKINTRIVAFIPRDKIVNLAEINRKTVIEWDPTSKQAQVYAALATEIFQNTQLSIPKPLSFEELEDLIGFFGIDN